MIGNCNTPIKVDKNTNTKNKLFGFGVGFGLLTKAGLFKLNYSSGKKAKTIRSKVVRIKKTYAEKI